MVTVTLEVTDVLNQRNETTVPWSTAYLNPLSHPVQHAQQRATESVFFCLIFT